MKNTYKLILLFFTVLLVFSGCAKKTYTPVLENEFDVNAVYTAGDFSYTCRIIKTDSFVSVTPTSTNAKGMTIKYDGETVSFTRNGMVKEFPRSSLDSTNPAVVLYEVFASLKNAPARNTAVKNSVFHYVGTTSIGTFTLIQNKSNSLKSISVPDAQIEIEFEQ